MPNRRQFLLAGSALGLPLASLLPVPAVGHRGLRLGLLQIREPFVDPHDPKGSRQRAFSALRALLQRCPAEERPPDWLVTSAFPLSGRPAREWLEDFSLTADCEEILWLRRFASRHTSRLSLTAFYRAPRREAAAVLLDFLPGGGIVRRPLRTACGAYTSDGFAVDPGLRPGSDAALESHCRRLRVYGAGIAARTGPDLPPGAPVTHRSRTRLIDPTGRVRAELPPREEGYLSVSL